MTRVDAMLSLHKFPEDPDLIGYRRVPADIRKALFLDGIPRGGLGYLYEINPTLSVLDKDADNPIVVFGKSGRRRHVGVDVSTGIVIHMVNIEMDSHSFVNSSIHLFGKTVAAVISRFPYYDKDDDIEKSLEIGGEIYQMIRSIDAPAALPDRFWSTFADDVGMGDFSTQDVLTVQRDQGKYP